MFGKDVWLAVCGGFVLFCFYDDAADVRLAGNLKSLAHNAIATSNVKYQRMFENSSCFEKNGKSG